MNLMLIGKTEITDEFREMVGDFSLQDAGKLVALTAIRTCYSHLSPAEIVSAEGMKYFKEAATDGLGGNEADRLIRHINNSGHTSTLEHISFTFTIQGVSRSLLAQLTRHRHFSFSVQSQRYVKFGSNDKSGGFEYITIPLPENEDAWQIYETAMKQAQEAYDKLRALKVGAEDARMVLPNGATCNLVFSGNLRSFIEFLSKRGEGTHAQWEIQDLAEQIKAKIIKAEPWTKDLFK